MQRKTLSASNKHLQRGPATASRMVKSVSTSTAIETGKPSARYVRVARASKSQTSPPAKSSPKR